MKSKKCFACGEIKKVDCFYKSSSTKDGYRGKCIKCFSVYSKNIRINNPLKYRLLNQSNRIKNSHIIKEKRSKYFNDMRDKYGLGSGTIVSYGFRLAIAVYDRAGRKCETCGDKNDLVIHHKDEKGDTYRERSGKKRNQDITNLIILCRACHGRLHTTQRWEKYRRDKLKKTPPLNLFLNNEIC